MDELNANTDDLDHLHNIAIIDLEQLLTGCIPREKLIPLVKARVKLVIEQFDERAPIPISTGASMASPSVEDHLCGALVIPLRSELCILMTRVGFDKALFTYGIVDGISVGYAERLWLLKFIGLAE